MAQTKCLTSFRPVTLGSNFYGHCGCCWTRHCGGGHVVDRCHGRVVAIVVVLVRVVVSKLLFVVTCCGRSCDLIFYFLFRLKAYPSHG